MSSCRPPAATPASTSRSKMEAAATQPSSAHLAPRLLNLHITQTHLRIPSCGSAPCRARLRRCSLSRSTPTPTNPAPVADPPDPLRVAFACGAPGGRVYSAIALADELHASLPGSRSLILGAPAPSLESTAAAAASYPFAPVPRCLPHALLAAALHLRRFGPHVLVATGGSASFPACLAALLLGLPFVIQDQDATPALATRLLAPVALRVFLAFNAPVRLLPKRMCAVYGNPVRMSIRKCRTSKAAALARFFPRAALVPEEGAQIVLVLGGAEGSPEINVAVLNMYYEVLRKRKDRYMI
jgi:UDP-N-acetylglucosamine--N-acetylmuramyl-(pentapeptide) pyrophosphoryl-undecaprenol N-acetylglucosamine transferase